MKMRKPRIGLTCHAYHDPLARSAVGQQYVDAILAAGGAPVALPIGLEGESLDSIYAVLDGLLLPGGDDIGPARYGHASHPALGVVDDMRDELELQITRRALEDDLPILGICRGIQVLAVAAGGTLYQDIPSEIEQYLGHDVRQHGRDHLCHTIQIQPASRLGSALGVTSTPVNSFHHQAVRDVPHGFSVTAVADDGVVEAIEATGKSFVVGVQCHPEGIWRTSAPHFARLFESFIDAVSERQTLRAA